MREKASNLQWYPLICEWSKPFWPVNGTRPELSPVQKAEHGRVHHPGSPKQRVCKPSCHVTWAYNSPNRWLTFPPRLFNHQRVCRLAHRFPTTFETSTWPARCIVSSEKFSASLRDPPARPKPHCEQHTCPIDRSSRGPIRSRRVNEVRINIFQPERRRMLSLLGT